MQRCMGCMREFGDGFDVCPHCGYIVGTAAAAKNHLAPGTLLQNRYTLGRVLGQGGFGITYIAWDNRIGRAVAVKEYMPNAFASRMTGEKDVSCYNEEAQRQFTLGLEKTRKETHALSQFGTLESVVKVYDCIEENRTAYIIMELLRGRTVKEILSERGKLTFAETMRIMTPVLQTLDAMHQVGMIHRDVAPDNIFVCEDGKIKLLDFGAARVVSGTDDKTLSVMLKAGYAPIEQYSSKAKQGAYTDVYAASATMYKMLTGETPPDSLSRAKDGGDLRALIQSDAPQNAQATLLRGMAPNADERIQSAKALLDALQKDAPENVAGIDPKAFLSEQKKKQTKKIAKTVLAAVLVICIVVGSGIAVHLKKTNKPEKNEISKTIPVMTDKIGLLDTSKIEVETTVPESEQGNSKWIAAYKTYLLDQIEQNIAGTDDSSVFEDYSPWQFSLIYLDDDDIPELVVSIESFHFAGATLVTYCDGELVTFSDLGTYGNFQFKEKQGIIVEEDAHSGVTGATVWRLSDGSLKCIWNGLEIYPELIGDDGRETEYIFRDVKAVEAFQESPDDSNYKALESSEKKVSEAEYKAAYSANVPIGLTDTVSKMVSSLTKKNVTLYFKALMERDSLPFIRGYDKITFSGTLSEIQKNDNESSYHDFQLDQPMIVQFKEDAFPALLTNLRIPADEVENITVGHTSLQGHPSRESDGSIWLW